MQSQTRGETRLIYYDVTANKVDLKTWSVVIGTRRLNLLTHAQYTVWGVSQNVDSTIILQYCCRNMRSTIGKRSTNLQEFGDIFCRFYIKPPNLQSTKKIPPPLSINGSNPKTTKFCSKFRIFKQKCSIILEN
jgi:hypothetical protein